MARLWRSAKKSFPGLTAEQLSEIRVEAQSLPPARQREYLTAVAGCLADMCRGPRGLTMADVQIATRLMKNLLAARPDEGAHK